LHPPSDFEVSSRQLITFHPLEVVHEPFVKVIELGTEKPLRPHEFYGLDEDRERIFKSLLRLTLQQKLYRHKVQWMHEDNLFIFVPKEEGDSLAQIFDELGNGLILRGTPIDMSRDDRVPHLTANQAYDLLTAALNEYRVALRAYPARIVVHKSSNFSADEIDGLTRAARDLRIYTVDLVTVMDSKLRLFRDGLYPPYRGTRV